MNDSEFLSLIGHTNEELETAKIDIGDLKKIHDEHLRRYKDLEDTGDSVQRALNRMPGVHSTRVRVKSPRSLVRKIVRKRTSDPERNICFDTYKDEVRDLIGLRALHLFKEQWEPIHKAILDRWHRHPDEQPLAYLREGDSDKLKETLEKAGFDVQTKKGGYRSLHFIVQTPFNKTPCYSEIQVRTLFEEAWGEVDHTVRYPDHEDDELLGEYLLILNRLAGGADEMASLLLRVKTTIETLRLANDEMVKEHEAKDAEIQKLRAENNAQIEKLAIGEEEKKALKIRFDDVAKTEIPKSLSPELAARIARLTAQNAVAHVSAFDRAIELAAQVATQNSSLYSRTSQEMARLLLENPALHAQAVINAARQNYSQSKALEEGKKPSKGSSPKKQDKGE